MSLPVTSSSSIGNNVRYAVNDAFTVVLTLSLSLRLNLSFYGPFGGCELDRGSSGGPHRRRMGRTRQRAEKRADDAK